jgi:hypothetical protein
MNGQLLIKGYNPFLIRTVNIIGMKESIDLMEFKAMIRLDTLVVHFQDIKGQVMGKEGGLYLDTFLVVQ